jgi:hypothetical protein
MRFLSNQLAHCVENHPGCRVQRASNWLPTRLLDVFPEELNAEYVRLVNGADVRSKASKAIPFYLTLSHVWGEDSFLTVTTANVSRLHCGILITDLPQCFQDAIDVSRRLSVRYLWIDSLW